MDSQSLLLLMELKVLIMMTRPHNITVVPANFKVIVAGNSNVLWPGQYYQKFQQQEALAAYFDFISFSAWPVFRFLAATFYTRCVLIGISLFLLLLLFSFLAEILFCNNVHDMVC